jgi:hypothetical protein
LHPAVSHRFPDGAALDNALVQCIQRTLDDETGAAFANICAALLSAVGDPTTRIVPLDSPNTAVVGSSPPGAPSEAQPLVRFTQDGIAVIEMTDHRQFADYTAKMPVFYARFAEARQKSKAIVFDLRSLHDVDRGVRDYWHNADTTASVYTFKFMFVEAFRSFLAAELLLPSRRARAYRGAPPAIRGAGAAARFGHGLLAWDGDIIPPADSAAAGGGTGTAAAAAAASQSEFVLIVNRRTPRALVDVGIAVQSAGIGKLVYEHDSVSERIGSPVFADADVAVVAPVSLLPSVAESQREQSAANGGEAPSGASPIVPFVALISTTELVASDGSLGFSPDAVVAPMRQQSASATTAAANGAFVSGADSHAYRAALGLLRGSMLPTRSTTQRASPHSRAQRDADPCGGQLPSLPYRCLSLFRAWHVLRHFYAHNDSLELDWQRVLVETLPKVRRASTELSYALCIVDLAAKLHDSTASVSCAALTRARGTHGPPLVVRRIGDSDVIVDAFADSLALQPMAAAAAAPRAVGDTAGAAAAAADAPKSLSPTAAAELIGSVIVRINGEPAAVVRRRAAQLVAGASSPVALDARVSPLLLAGDQGSPVLVQWRTADGSLYSHTFFRTVPLARCAQQPRAACPPIGVVPASADAAAQQSTGQSEQRAPTGEEAAAAAAEVLGGIAYVDLERADSGELQRVWSLLAKQKSLVLDARHGCRAQTHSLLVSLLASGDERGASTAKSFMPMVFGDEVASDHYEPVVAFRTHRVSVGLGGLPSGRAVFENGVTLLVDGTTTAAAEQACYDVMAVRSDTTLVGQPTAGVCGVASNCTLAGGVMLGFTARGTELAGVARRGLQPTISVAVTRQAVATRDDTIIAVALSDCRARIAKGSTRLNEAQ